MNVNNSTVHSTSTHETGISFQSIKIIRTELINALVDPEVLPGYKNKTRAALNEINQLFKEV